MIENYLNRPFVYGHETITIEKETDEQFKTSGEFFISVYDPLRSSFRFFTWVDKVTKRGLHWKKSIMNKRVSGVILFEDLEEQIETVKEGGDE